jgi:polyphosphate kinase
MGERGDEVNAEGFRARAGVDPHLNVDLSELAFIGRLLAVANDGGLALLERVRFLALVSEALDNFFHDRMSALHRAARDRADARRTLVLVRSHVDALLRRQDRMFHAVALPRLAEHGVRVLRWGGLDDYERAVLTQQFVSDILPRLGAVELLREDAVSAIPDLGFCLLVSIGRRAPITQAVAVVAPDVPRLLGLPGGAYVRLEDLIAAHRHELATHLGWSAARPFRVTRSQRHTNIDLSHDAQLLDLRAGTVGEPVRLEVQPTMPGRMRDRLARQLGLARVDVYDLVPFLETGPLWALAEIDRPDLRGPRREAVAPAGFAGTDVFSTVSERDVIVHHPHESFDSTVLAMVETASNDPAVVAVRQTLPPVEPESPMVAALTQAARNGKYVDVVVAPQARLGEQGSLEWVKELRQLGARVGFGPAGARVHAKVTTVVRNVDGGVRSYVHIGTGNYDVVAARRCEDVSLFTSSPAIALAVHDVFDALLTGAWPDISALAGVAIVSPAMLRQRLLAMIKDERVAPERSRQIILKVNHLVDPEIIDALYDASTDGVQIDIIVRGTCALRPGVPGMSERIRVRSVVGPVLEHSRVFAFGAGKRARWFVGSADLLPCERDERVEFVVPVDDEAACERLREIVSTALLDDARAWDLRSDGAWHRVSRRIGVDGQESLLGAARSRLEESAGSL